jgi:hypothetical protein
MPSSAHGAIALLPRSYAVICCVNEWWHAHAFDPRSWPVPDLGWGAPPDVRAFQLPYLLDPHMTVPPPHARPLPPTRHALWGLAAPHVPPTTPHRTSPQATVTHPNLSLIVRPTSNSGGGTASLTRALPVSHAPCPFHTPSGSKRSLAICAFVCAAA